VKRVTKHGNKRVRQRIKAKDVERVASIAFQDGLRQRETKGRLAKYLASLSLTYLTDPVIYNENVFVYSKDQALVTTFPLPFRYRSSANSQQKRKDEQSNDQTKSTASDPNDSSSGASEDESE